MANLEQYKKMHNKYLKGKLTDEEWLHFCDLCLDELLIENEKIFEKLKKPIDK